MQKHSNKTMTGVCLMETEITDEENTNNHFFNDVDSLLKL